MLAAMPVSRTIAKSSKRDTHMVTGSYVLFLCCATVVFNVLSDGLSSLLTLSAGLLTLAFMLLVLKVQGQSNVSGISTSMLAMYTCTLVLRLSSTLWLPGYLPADSTGDWAFQCLELLSLGAAGWLLRHITKSRRMNYGGAAQDEQDTMPGLRWIVLGCAIFAWFFHADLNLNTTFDFIWAFGCYLETVSMLPQLWMMAKAGGEVEALTSHFIALTAAARFFSFCFWYLAFKDDISFDGNYSEIMIIGAHVLQLVFACDFLFLYVKSFGKRVPIGEVSSQWI